MFSLANSRITAEQALPDGLYIIRFGLVLLSIAGRAVEEVQPGSLFGELAMLGLTQDGKRARSAVAKTTCELCMLSQSDFEEMLRANVDFLHVVTKVVKCHVASLRLVLAQNGGLPSDCYTRIDWKKVGRLLERDAVLDAKRKHLRNPDAWETKQGPGVLFTTMRLDILSLSGFAPKQHVPAMVCVVYWVGASEDEGSFVQDETLIIPSSRADDQGEQSFMNRDIVLTIPHKDLRWEAMADLQVVILEAEEDDLTLPRSRSQITAAPQHTAGCSHVYPNTRQIFGMNVGALLSPSTLGSLLKRSLPKRSFLTRFALSIP